LKSPKPFGEKPEAFWGKSLSLLVKRSKPFDEKPEALWVKGRQLFFKSLAAFLKMYPVRLVNASGGAKRFHLFER